MSTVVSVLRRRAQTQPEVPAFCFVDEVPVPDVAGSDVTATYHKWDVAGSGLTATYRNLDMAGAGVTATYRALDVAARSIAAELVDRDAAGQPVLLLYPPGLDYVAGFLGCLYAGAVAVPAYPPDAARWSRTLPRLRGLVRDCGAAVALTVTGLAELAPAVAEQAPELAGLGWVATDTLPAEAAEGWVPPDVAGDTPALLQYTSGSTGPPRGVLLSHTNLLHNAGLVSAGFGTSAETVGVSWLPPYHDMGLIGGILQPLYAGFPVVLMSPLSFLRRPLAWLETISRTGATMSGGPNFAFDLCVRKTTAAQRATVDLSRWQVAFCGAEPVRADTLDRFAAAFAPAGFRREAFYPCYGLAEATLIVTGGRLPAAGRPGTGGRSPQVTAAGGGQVSCGRPLGDQRLVVVDPATGEPSPPGAEGEVWLSGPSVAQGYWRRPDETGQTFDARLAGDPDRRYLRTGDLGQLTPAGELVVTGRIKDLIIVRGRNLHPPDLEVAVEREVPGLRPGCIAAFPVVRDGAEQVGIAGELADPNQDPAPVVAAIRQVISETAEVAAATVILLRRGRVPKTSSGKIQRYACRRAAESGEWVAGSSDVLARFDDGSAQDRHNVGDIVGFGGRQTHNVPDIVSILVGTVAGVLGVPPEAVPAEAPLTGLGLDSMRAIELQGTLEAGLGLRVPLSDLLTGVTAGELAERAVAAEPRARRGAEVGPSGSGAEAGPSGSGAGPVPDEWPASPGQRALWLIERSTPDHTAYLVSRAARIRSPVDPDRLERALRAAVDRHPALRTCLPNRGGEPVQRVFDWCGPVLTRYQVPDLDEAALRQRVQADADRGFDLERGPLFRVSLYSRGESDHVLLLSMHHTITDFWSLTILVDELLADYHAAVNPPGGHAAPAVPATEPGELHDQRVRYWREALAGAPPVLDLPTSFPRPQRQSYRGASEPLQIPPEVLRRLDRVAAESGVTRFALLAAGFAAVLARYTGEPDVVIGAPTAGRDGHQHHQLGYFVNPVPLRVRADPAGSFRELAGQVRQAVAAALDHPVPFARLVEELRPVRDPGRTPILQAMMVLQVPPAGRPDLGGFAVADKEATVQLGGLELQPYRLADRVAAFDLSVSLAESGGGLAGDLNYATDLFDQPTVARLAGHLTRLLARAAAEPDRPLRTLPLLAEQERAAVLAMSTGPVQSVREQTTLDELLAETAARQPDAVAVVAGEQQVTYAELQRRVDRLAARLEREHRVRPGQLVGVHLPRGPDAIIAFWAALRSGGAYLPLETGLPPARLAWLLGDARPALLLTHREVAERTLRGVPPGDRPPLLCLDEPATSAEPDGLSELAARRMSEATALAPADEPSAGSRAGPDDLAYVIYTSGSTGRPKGVMIPHRCVAYLSQIRPPSWGVTPASRVLQFASCAFDVHIADIVTAHTSGAALHLPPEEATMPGPALLALLAEQRITFAGLPPSVLAALPDAELPDLAQIMSGGEACTSEVVARWAPGRRFGNAYGPTETTIGITWKDCRPDGRRPTLGGPNPNSQMYVLDDRMEPVPVGVPGELYLGGAGVGWGYLGRPGLTAERFVADPFRGPASRGRLYRTGDRARWLPDGTLDFLGRVDDQVQIRGIRVEPGEVEVRIRELLRIREVAVVPRPGPGGTPELVAYLVAPDPGRMPAASGRSAGGARDQAAGPSSGAASGRGAGGARDQAGGPGITVPELRARLRARLRAVLPEPWVPAAFVWLSALPLNPSGKLDRWALPEPAPSDRGLAAPVAPRTELERTIAEVWAAALGQPAVGVRDHFFEELGGGSLLVGRVTSELGQRLDRELPVTLLFEHPTVEALARHLADEPGSEPPGPAPEDWAARRRRALAARRSGLGGVAE